MNQLINQPRPTVSEKKGIDPNSIMSYEDVLKDIDQTNAVVYEDIQQNQQPPIQQHVPQQMKQQKPPQVHQSLEQPDQTQFENQQHDETYTENQQQLMQQQLMQQQLMQQQLMQQQQMQQQMQTPQKPSLLPSHFHFDKKLINDCVIIIIVYVLLNNEAIKNVLLKYIPSSVNGSAIYTLINAIIFVISWICLKVGFSYVSDKL